jgi:hypothetical protein
MAADAEWNIPQIHVIFFAGFNILFVVYMPRMNVAESAKIIKKQLLKK